MNTPNEKDKIQVMSIGGRKLASILNQLKEMSRPGINLRQIERKAWTLIEKAGGYPSFATVPGYSHATCLNINGGVVHGVPFDYELQEGNLLTIDVGFLYKGYHTDCARSFLIRAKKKQISPIANFLKTGEKALQKAIASAVFGNRVGDISKTIGDNIKSKGFWPVLRYTGHGVGTELHQKPPVPCFLEGSVEKTTALSYNMTIAIEVIYTMEKTELKVSEDGWTVKTENNCPAACFEKTIAIDRNNTKILTPW